MKFSLSLPDECHRFEQSTVSLIQLFDLQLSDLPNDHISVNCGGLLN
jgi:hypothetical protein